MSLTETILEGTIQPDGTLVLDKKLNLRPGRVKVVLQQEAEIKPLSEDWWQYLQRCCQELEASGGEVHKRRGNAGPHRMATRTGSVRRTAPAVR